ncbi:unnamed protein product [Sphagnum balticum]
MIYCNPVPIAAACYLDKEVTEAILSSFAHAVGDLTELGKSLDFSIGVASIKIVNKHLTYSYSSNFAKQLNDIEYEKNLKKSLKETKAHWEEGYNDKWGKSGLSQLITKPSLDETNKLYEKGLALKIMSLDLNSTEKPK